MLPCKYYFFFIWRVFAFIKPVENVNHETTENKLPFRDYIKLFRILPGLWAYGVVVNMFDFQRSDRGSNPGHGGKIS